MIEIQPIFDRMLRRAQRMTPGLQAVLRTGSMHEFRSKRAFAMCTVEPGPHGYTIIVAPDLSHYPKLRIQALLAHELGHASLLHRGLAQHSERQADLEAERLFQRPMAYDAQDVQTWGPGVRPRPAHLPK